MAAIHQQQVNEGARLIEEAKMFLFRFDTRRSAGATGNDQDGLRLALELRDAACLIGTSRVTENWPELPQMYLLSAKLAVACLEPGDPQFEMFEKDILYYRNFPSTSNLVDEYESFKNMHSRQSRSVQQ